MNRTFTAVAVFVLALVTGASAAEPSLKAFEDQIQLKIESRSSGVVSIVVSHRKYPDRAKLKPGQLGGYETTPQVEDFRGGRWPGQRLPPPNPLDLANADNTADNLFGSGVVLDAKEGLILTPQHLIEGATKIYVRGPGGKGSYADIRAFDTKSDLAVLKLIGNLPDLKAIPIAPVQLADMPDGSKPNLKKGSMVIALGHPQASGVGEGSPSASWGIVAAIRQRSAPTPGATPNQREQKALHAYGGLIQTDARVALGSSGSALINLDGELVGIGSSVAAVFGSEANGGYAIPMEANYRRIIGVLKEGKEVEYGFLGIQPAEDNRGVRIVDVTPGCPAIKAGLQGGDVITAIDGNALKSNDDLLFYVGGALAGTTVTVDYIGLGQTRKTKLTLAKNINSLPFLATVLPPSPFGLKVDYHSIKFAGGFLGGQRFPPNIPDGVLIRDTAAGSEADKRLKVLGQPKAGSWLVTHVDGKPVGTPKEFHAAIQGKAAVKLSLCDPDDPTAKETLELP